jgi:hypothetical protein
MRLTNRGIIFFNAVYAVTAVLTFCSWMNAHPTRVHPALALTPIELAAAALPPAGAITTAPMNLGLRAGLPDTTHVVVYETGATE